MKKILPWLLLAIYLNASAQVVLPFARDMIAHLLFWEDHLEHVHHGEIHSDHVHTDLQAAAGEHAPDTSAPSAFHKDALSAHLVPDCIEPAAQISPLFTALNVNWRFPKQTAFPPVFSPPPDRV